MLILTWMLRMTDMIILMNREAEDTCMRRTMTALVVHFLTALKMSRRNGLSDSLVIWWSRLLVTSTTTRCSSLLSPLPCKCFGIGSYEVEYDFSFVLQGALVWALGSTAWLHTVWSEAEWASWSEVLRNEKIGLFFDNKEATTFGWKK